MSAKHSDGTERLIEAIKRVCAMNDVNNSDMLVYNERQRTLTMNAVNCVTEAIETLNIGLTLDAVTVLIEEAIGHLCELTGERVTDEVIDKVFHQFCVGK
jgi:tRNA modification GTPase